MKESTVRKGKLFKENKITDVVLAVIPVILLCIFPTIFLYFNNVGNLRFVETIWPMVISAAIGAVLWLAFSLFCRSFVDGSICAFIICMVGFNFSLIEQGIRKVCRSIKYWHLLPIMIFLVVIILMIILDKLDYSMRKDINFVCLIVVGGLVMFNVIKAVPQLINYSSQESVKVTNSQMVNVDAVDKEMPNIYWMIFDEYSNFDVLEKYFDYDNSEFSSFLEENGFTVSYNSFNESFQTRTILTNYMYLDYIANDSMSYNERAEMIKKRTVFNLLENGGYELRALSGNDMFGLEGDTMMASTTIGGEDFATLICKNTVMYPFIKQNAYESAKEYLEVFKKFESKEMYDAEVPQVNFAYFVLPHQPFCFDKTGGTVPLSHANDWVNKEYYLNQLIFTTNKIENAVEDILKNDSDSIIIIQSDHSARNLQTADGKGIIENVDKRQFLNAVYYKGEAIKEIEGKSGVNTLRYVFGKLLDVDMPELEVPCNE